MNTLENKIALVTGGTTGIGRATAIAFARAGAKVVVSGRREKEGEETLQLVRQAGGTAIFVRADVKQDADVKNSVDATLRTWGRLDIAFNNAGVESERIAPTADQGEADYDHVMAVNVKGVFLAMKHEIAAMLRTGGGAIVNTSSVAGLIGFAGASPYTAAKHAVVGLTRSAAIEYGKQGIRVNAVAPAAIDTPMLDRFTEVVPRTMLESLHPIGRIGKPAEIADAVVWLCSPQASFVTGQTLAIDGGFTAQ
ncbi:MAG: SDR family oxidoreductase [Planctomycetota bacterium]